jgi:hypothetical protein
MQDLGYELPRIPIPRTWVNRDERKLDGGTWLAHAELLRERSIGRCLQMEPLLTLVIALGGITTGAVRNRLPRGTLPSTKESGTVYVLVPDDMSRDTERHPDDTPPEMSQPDSDALISEIRDRLRYVEGQLEAEREAHAEARRIIAGLVERIPPALEAGAASSSPRIRRWVNTATHRYRTCELTRDRCRG